MPSIIIHPLHLGTITRHKDSFTFKLGYGTTIDVPIIAWYIEGAEKKILVDTGGCDPEDPEQKPWRAPYTRTKDQEIVTALKRKVGVNPEEIDIVINNHLHWDHCSGNDLFPNAKILVQKRELEAARNPIPLLSVSYIWKYIHGVNYTELDGDVEIVKGVSVVLLPGHTEGLQGVLVEARENRYLLAGDCIPLFESLNHKPPWPNGIYVNLREYYTSLDKISKLDAIVLPGHDLKVFERETYS